MTGPDSAPSDRRNRAERPVEKSGEERTERVGESAARAVPSAGEQTHPDTHPVMLTQEQQAYALGFLFDGTGRVVLIRKRRPAWQAGLLNGVGGKVEPGEAPA